MASVLCSSKLHRALAPGRRPGADTGAGDEVLLGDWAATLAGSEFMVAVEERTCLTLVVRLRPLDGLRDRLAAALRVELGECGVSPDAIERECESLERAWFLGHRHSAVREALAFAEMEVGAHAEGGQPEDSVQAMLNTYPYGECEAACPIEAVPLLFGVSARSSLDRNGPRSLRPEGPTAAIRREARV